MLRHDPIVLRFSELLPSEQEVGLARELLARPEQLALARAVERSVAIGSVEATLWRYCWQSREGGRRGQACAEGAVEWLRVTALARSRLAMDAVLRAPLFTEAFRDLFFAVMPFSCHGVDRLGHPVYIVRQGQVRAEAFGRLWSMGQALQQREGLAVNATVLFALRSFEYLTKVVMADESLRQGRVVDRVLFVSDFEGLQLSQLDASFQEYCKSMAREMIALFPETLHCTIVANVPWMIAWNAWPLIRRLLHPVTRAKVQFLHAGSLRQKLLELVESDSLPPYLGGSCRCRECASGQLRGGSMWAWEEAQGVAGTAAAPAVAPVAAAPRHGGPLRVLTDCCSCCGGAEKTCGPGAPRQAKRPLPRGAGGEGPARGPRGSWPPAGGGQRQRLLAAGPARTRKPLACGAAVALLSLSAALVLLAALQAWAAQGPGDLKGGRFDALFF